MNEYEKHANTFYQEADELLADIEQIVLDIEQEPENKENLNRLFRAMHTIKGSGSMFGYDDITDFTHHVETLLDKVREGEVPVSRNLIDIILASRDYIKALMTAKEQETSVDTESGNQIISVLEALMPQQTDVPAAFLTNSQQPAVSSQQSAANSQQPTANSQQPTANSQQPTVHPCVSDTSSPPLMPGKKHQLKTCHIRFCPDPEIIITGMEPIYLLNEFRTMGECIIVGYTDRVPALDKFKPELCYIYWDIILTTLYDVQSVRDVFIFVEEGSQINIRIVEEHVSVTDNPLPRLGEILIERGDATHEDINSILCCQKRIGEMLVASGTVSEDKVFSALNEQKALDHQRIKAKSSSVRVPADRLDALVNLVGEMVIMQARISQLFTSLDDIEQFDETQEFDPFEYLLKMRDELMNPVKTLERITREMRDCTLNMRMLPIGTIFSRFRRMVRDLSAELSKEIMLVTEGGDTELDKTVIERLNDPLMHLIRNSIDHGIQSPEKRIKAGKPRQGTIRLNAAHRGANVMIIIEDDGMGLDPDAIRRKALEKGLITENLKLSESEVFSLLFLPGFSTADKVTSVSGRGVGMDVVKREIESLGGSVRITSQKKVHTTITLSLPLTLAIIDGLLVHVGNQPFVMPQMLVEECVEFQETGRRMQDAEKESEEDLQGFAPFYKSGLEGLSEKSDFFDQHPEASIQKPASRNQHPETSTVRGTIPIRGKLIPLIRLTELFGISGSDAAKEQVAVVRVEELRVGIVVDKIIGGVQTVIKPLGRIYRDVEYISGATVMGDGTVALILDVPGLIRYAMNE